MTTWCVSNPLMRLLLSGVLHVEVDLHLLLVLVGVAGSRLSSPALVRAFSAAFFWASSSLRLSSANVVT